MLVGVGFSGRMAHAMGNAGRRFPHELTEAQVISEQWRHRHKIVWPHSVSGYRANILDAVVWPSLAYPPRLELELSASLRWGQAMPISQRSGEMSRLALAEGKRMAQVVVHEVAHGLPVVIHVGAIL